MVKNYIYAGTYVIIMGLLFKLFAVGTSVSGKVEDYADNVDQCIDLALKGQVIADCIEQQNYKEDISSLDEIVKTTVELNSKINSENIKYENGVLSFSYNGEIVNLPMNISKD